MRPIQTMHFRELPTINEIKKLYGECRNLVVEMHPSMKDRVISFSYEAPCYRCAEYHEMFSKEEEECFRNSLKCDWELEPDYECPHCEGSGRIDYEES